jgi:hypothetical protein
MSLLARLRSLFTSNTPTTEGDTMTSSDQFNVTATIAPDNPKTGDTLTLTISGDDVVTTTTAGTIGPLTLALKAADGATTEITVPEVPYQLVTASHESVVITGVTDPSGRSWTVAQDGLTATATA